ncbi:polysaccharide export outer membrane protein [Salegentibacter echinorum]|uniref:Polysaccharide export outer membrane protein n=1 Tax=Salegentibacter echinorum TaxID=1073325 RepID=A0A1M5BV96_SALEC|nr:polysaccharide biosynthesis/export family protein [Salegentibacter echinorum]SHF46483.1 polysaccharide export outer membrane protein [Salegentibacter echinorum]
MKFPKFFRLSFFALLSVLLTTSCVSRQEIVYFQGLEEAEAKLEENTHKEGIKANDLLTISVAAAEQEAALPYNLPVVAAPQGGINMAMSINGRQQLQTYLVSKDGNIQFPQLGKLEVKGLGRQELSEKLEQQLEAYIQDPIVTVKIVNFEVSVLGEVNRPGTFTIEDGYISLPQALGLANDLSIYGRRDNVLVMREDNGKKTHAYLDLTDADVINSPYYYLQQNDVVYIEPNGPQRQSASYNRNASVYISIASVLVSLIVLIAR